MKPVTQNIGIIWDEPDATEIILTENPGPTPSADTCTGCNHPTTEHRSDGCHHSIGHCDICWCRVDVATLTAKITEIGER